MAVQKQALNCMRLSLLTVFITASAILGFLEPARGQIEETSNEATIKSQEETELQQAPTTPDLLISSDNLVVETIDTQEVSAPENQVIVNQINPEVLLSNLSVGKQQGKINLPLVAQEDGGESEDSQDDAVEAEEARVLVGEVLVKGAEGIIVTDENGEQVALENIVYDEISTKPGRTTTRSKLQEDLNAVYATGYFANATVVPEDTPLGVRITFNVEPNPVLKNIAVQTLPEGSQTQVLPPEVIEEIFSEQYGSILNLRELQENIEDLNEWYREQGYELAQVIGTSDIGSDGVLTLRVAEGVIEDIKVRFFNEEGEEVEGRTREFIVTREVEMKPGDVFNRETALRDLQRIFGLSLFDNPRFTPQPGNDPSKVVLNIDVVERSTGSIAAGAGLSSASGLFGTVSYQQQNLGGNNQTIGAELQLGTREFLFDLRFTDPWIATDPYRTSYTVNAFRRRSISLIFDGGETEVNLANGDTPRVLRTGGGITFSRPLEPNPYRRSDWRVSAGFQYQGVVIRDADGETTATDSLGNNLSFSGSGRDDLFSFRFGAVRDLRNNPLQPTQGSLLRLGMDQTVPVGEGSIFFNRVRASYSYYIPVDYTNFSEGAEALAFNIQGGTVLGDLPPYEAFAMGGTDSVRGYEAGDVGSGRSYLQATAEYRFPVFSVIGGALFVDVATDLGTGDDVPGNPAGVRDKPGSGIGYGLGVRIQSPLGPIRVDYGLNDQGDSRIHFGIGERF